MAGQQAAEVNAKKPRKQDPFDHPDFYNLDALFGEEQKLVRSAIRDFVKKEITPFIEDWAERAHFPYEIVRKFGDIGAFGPTIPAEYGGGGLDYISYGLIMQEIERGDSGMRSTASVQGSLVMYPIYKFGSEEQRKKYLPKLGSGEWLGCFGLTEPDFGSNPGGMVTHFKDAGDHYLLNGAKMWISNSPKADLAVVWAKNEEGRVHGLIVERGMEGFSTPEMHGKSIVDGPLPFLFGAEAAKIQQRYWVGVFTPKDAKGEYWLEAWPKFREDAKNYKKVEIIIDETDFLPKAIQIFDHNGNNNDPSSTVLTFEKRDVNFKLSPLGGLDPLELFAREFIEPSTPFGYKKETIKFDAANGAAPAQARQPRGTQASRVLPQMPLRKR